MGTPLRADYLIMGAGATGMAFADSVFSETEATMVLVDRHDRPGGHWNDAYPFVRLHQPASFYGVDSAPLGRDAVDDVGHNAGFYELASGQEVLSHFDHVLRNRLLASGRVRFFPVSEVGDDGVITSLLSGERTEVDAGRFVDAAHSKMQVPSTTSPSYSVDSGVTCVPLNDLPRVACNYDDFVVIGAGKTGMDACVWLLDNGADPGQVRWIMPRDSWVLHRRNFQPGEENFAGMCQAIANQVEALTMADSVADLFARLEAAGDLVRIDPTVEPGAYHCAILSDGELGLLRSIDGVIRLGRVTGITVDEIRLEQGSVPTTPRTLHVDCSAAGIPTLPSKPVFDGDRITLQWVRTCQPTFSAAMIGVVESRFDDEAVKNTICTPIVPPTVPLDWLRMMRVELANRQCWTRYPQIGEWLARTRLDVFTKLAIARLGVDVEAAGHLQRYLHHMPAALANLDQLLEL